MSDSTTITIRVARSVKDRLENLARETRRSRSSLAAEGISNFVDLGEQQIAGIKQAMRSVDQGRVTAHNEVTAWIESWDTEDEQPAPNIE